MTEKEFNLSEKIESKKPLINMACTNLQGQARLDFLLSIIDDINKDIKEFIRLLKENFKEYNSDCKAVDYTETNCKGCFMLHLIDKLAGDALNGNNK